MLKYRFIALIALFFLTFSRPHLIAEDFAEGITIDLREPEFVEGVLTTDKGGVIKGPDLRIQALKIRYMRQMVDERPVYTLEAEDQLIVEFGEYIFTGKKLYYDFQKKEGIITQGRTSSEPWYFGGETIELFPNGSYLIHEAYITTSEGECPDWQIKAKKVEVFEERLLKASHVQLRVLSYPILWIPSFKANLSSIFDSPLKYRFRWGGRQGPRIGLTYEVFSWEKWKVFLRFDYRLTRGPGGGIEFSYQAPDHKTEFQSVNYIAKDSSLWRLHEKVRYRFEGSYRKLMDDDKTSILFTYDKVSDIDLPSSYYDKDFYFETSKRTQLSVRRQEDDWITNFYARAKVNGFQTVKQELPTFDISFRPQLLGQTGIICENWIRASYLNFQYSNHLIHVHDYDSTRFEYCPKFYRPFLLGPVTVTPQVGGVTILYGNSPESNSQWLALGFLGGEIRTQLYRYYGQVKHIIEPYSSYQYYTPPASSPHHHFIFDIDDGWYHLNMLTVGVKNALYAKRENSCISRIFFTDFYAHAFFNKQTFRSTVPKVYNRCVFFTLPTIRHTLTTAWNFEYQQLDHFNFHTEWTVNPNLAISAEFRHRCAFSWRKVDPDNFFLDIFRNEKQLRHSPLSDRRDTFLLHLFYRFHPNWSFEFASRNGWNRLREPNYMEYEIDLTTTIQTAWHLRFSFQHTENDNRVAMYVNVGLKRPSQCQEQKTHCYD